MTIGVVIADDQALLRGGFRLLVDAAPDMELLGEAANGAEAVAVARRARPDVVLMDLRMPDLDGPSAMKAILANNPSTRVLALTVAADEADVSAAIVAGACGYLLKDSPIDDVVDAVSAAARGVAWLSPKAAETLLDRIRRDYSEPGTVTEPELEADLSPRELEVLQLVARGLDNGEIAAELSISPRTAKNHVSNILAKLEVPNRIQAATYAVRSGLV